MAFPAGLPSKGTGTTRPAHFAGSSDDQIGVLPGFPHSLFPVEYQSQALFKAEAVGNVHLQMSHVVCQKKFHP